VAEDRVAVIAAVLIDRPVCIPCIANKVGITSGELPAYLHRVGKAFAVYDEIGRCRTCGTVTTVFSLRPARATERVE